MADLSTAALYSDVVPDAAWLMAKFGDEGESPHFPRSEWAREVRNRDTVLGYWEWLAHRYEACQVEDEATVVRDLVEEAVAHARSHGYQPGPGDRDMIETAITEAARGLYGDADAVLPAVR